MAEEVQQTSQIQFLLSDFNTRIKDAEERNRAVRERVLLLGKNLITSKEDIDEELSTLKKLTAQMKRDLEKIKGLTKNIVKETDKFVRRDELLIIERMLKDFQPLDFVRRKDFEELTKKLKQTPSPSTKGKQIKTKKTNI